MAIWKWQIATLLFPDEDDPLIDLLPEYRFEMEDLEEDTEDTVNEPEGNPTWRVQIEYSNHTEQDTSGYTDYLPERPEELYFSLLEYFEIDEEDL